VTKEFKGLLLCVAGGIFFGTAGTATNLIDASADSGTIGFSRILVGAVALLIVAPFFGGKYNQIPGLLKKKEIYFMALGAGMYQPFFFGAVERTGVAWGTLVAVGSIPVFAGTINWFLTKKNPSRSWFIATTIAVFGLYLIASQNSGETNSVGILMALLAGLATAIYVSSAKQAISKGANAVLAPTLSYFVGSILLMIVIQPDYLDLVTDANNFLLALYLGIFTFALANGLQLIGLRHLTPPVAATLFLADPLTATFLGVVVLGESLAGTQVFGLLLVLVGLIWQGLTLKPEEVAPRV
jgi:DME family drug/metabolite transporter